jgi:hypothetical protein
MYFLHPSGKRERREYNEIVHYLFIDVKITYDLITRELLYIILLEVGLSMKLLRIIKVF